MIDLITTPMLIEDRREYLRSLAAPRLPSVEGGHTRQWIGHLVIRFGQWVEGRCPEVIVEQPARGSWRSA